MRSSADLGLFSNDGEKSDLNRSQTLTGWEINKLIYYMYIMLKFTP